MMETFSREEETIRNASYVSGTVSNILEAMATQYHNLLGANPNMHYTVTVFDLHQVPDIQLKDYLFRIMTMSKCTYRDLIAALVYVETLINKGVISGISFHNMHRLVALSIMTSTKFYDDVHYSNRSWSKIVGIPLRELNDAETEFLRALNFEINIKFESLEMWAGMISNFAETPPVPTQASEELETQTDEHMEQEPTELVSHIIDDSPDSIAL